MVITINPIPPTPTVSIGAGNTHYCQNQLISPVTASGPSTIVWYGNAALTQFLQTGAVFAPTTLPLGTNTFYLIDSSAAGCKSVASATVAITIDPNPATPLLTGPASYTYCQNQAIISVHASGANTILWFSDPALTQLVDTGTIYHPTGLNTGTNLIYLIDSSAAGCKSLNTATLAITIHPNPTAPVINGSNHAVYCQGSSLNPIVAGASGNTIIWYTNPTSTPPVLFTGNSYTPPNLPIGTTVFYLSDTSSFGCKSSAVTSVSVTINPKPSITGIPAIDSARCSKNSGSITGLNVSNGTPPYTYQWVNASGNIVSTSLNLNQASPGTYSLIATDANLCKDTSSGGGFSIGGSMAPHASFNPSTFQGTTPLAITCTNTSTGASNYNWYLGDNNATSTQTNSAYTYTTAGIYTITLIAYKGNCSDTAIHIITVDINEVIIVPNVFSPNGDGINDQFFINAQGISSLNCDIYNRWGQLIYSIKSVNQEWDGVMNNGNRATESTYFYILNATAISGKNFKLNGDILLVR